MSDRIDAITAEILALPTRDCLAELHGFNLPGVLARLAATAG
jgi:hypothetical protein